MRKSAEVEENESPGKQGLTSDKITQKKKKIFILILFTLLRKTEVKLILVFFGQNSEEWLLIRSNVSHGRETF